MVKTNNIRKIYEINDIFSVIGYSLVYMGILSSYSSLGVEVIPVDSIVDVFKGLLNTSATGNLVAFGLGVGSLLVEKYFRYGRLM